MEYRKSYRGFALWLAGYVAAMIAPVLLDVDASLMTRLSLNICALGLPALCGLMLRTERVYWINGTSFEQARDAGSERRREFARAHLRVFGRFALGYLLFSAIMQWRGVSIAVDCVVFTVGIFVTAFSTTKIKL